MNYDLVAHLDQIKNLSLEDGMVLGIIKAKADPITGVCETTFEEIAQDINAAETRLQNLGLLEPVFDNQKGYGWKVNLPTRIIKAIQKRRPNCIKMLDDYLASKGIRL